MLKDTRSCLLLKVLNSRAILCGMRCIVAVDWDAVGCGFGRLYGSRVLWRRGDIGGSYDSGSSVESKDELCYFIAGVNLKYTGRIVINKNV